ncbi:MAG: metallophosphoesterase family protein [Filomicrobium sp.]
MTNSWPVLDTTEPVLVFGGPYGNLQATRALLEHANRLNIPPSQIICTGDLAAYCADPRATIELVLGSGIHCVMGNCDEQLANDLADCGCGFDEGSQCERLALVWFNYARRMINSSHRQELAKLPRRIDLMIGGGRFAVIHGGVDSINRFIFATTNRDVKRGELELAVCDGVIGGHCGLPFSEAIDGLLWHNPGVIGMPANDGTARVWYSVLTPSQDELLIEHHSLDYDHATAADAMVEAGLPQEYRESLSSGLWPNCDILPMRESEARGVALAPSKFAWKSGGQATGSRDRSHDESGVIWPDCLR